MAVLSSDDTIRMPPVDAVKGAGPSWPPPAPTPATPPTPPTPAERVWPVADAAIYDELVERSGFDPATGEFVADAEDAAGLPDADVQS